MSKSNKLGGIIMVELLNTKTTEYDKFRTFKVNYFLIGNYRTLSFIISISYNGKTNAACKIIQRHDDRKIIPKEVIENISMKANFILDAFKKDSEIGVWREMKALYNNYFTD